MGEKQSVGTPAYHAPELLANLNADKYGMRRYNFKVDVFAFGTLCFEVLTQEMVTGKKQLKRYEELEEGNHVELISDDCPPDFVSCCTSVGALTQTTGPCLTRSSRI